MKFTTIFLTNLTAYLLFSLVNSTNIKRTRGCNKFTSKSLPEKEKATIVLANNLYRSTVAKGETEGIKKRHLPKAANMRQVYWSDDIAKIAQSWADNCELRESPDSLRLYKNYTLGETIFSYSSKGPLAVEQFHWDRAVNRWYSEVTLFNYNRIFPYPKEKNSKQFAQVAWADSYLVGCGYSFYEEGGYNVQLYICHYAPEGGKPGQAVYIEGKPCSKCDNGLICSNEWESLCCIQTKCGKENWKYEETKQ